MKKTILLLSAIMILCGQVFGIVMLIEDTEIKNGDVYDYIQVFGNATIDVTGGNITGALVTFGSNTINVTGGYIDGLGTNLGEGTVFNIYNNANIGKLTISEPAKGYINGGSIGIIDINTSSTVNLTGGNITDYLVVSSEINIHGYNFDYDPFAGAYDGGQLIGFWLDGSAFLIDLKNYGGGDMPIESTYDNLNLVPEPTTLALLGVGGILLRRRK